MFLKKTTSLIEFDIKFDVAKLNESVASIASKVDWDQNQISLQHRDGVTELNDGIGSIWYKPGEAQSDSEFRNFYSEFEDEYLVQALQSLPFNVYRTRIMCIQPKRCYTIHEDKAIRFHIPVDTAERKGRFIFDHGEVLNLEEGSVYVLNTKLTHTALNAHPKLPRIHIVGCLEDVDETTHPVMQDIYRTFEL